MITAAEQAAFFEYLRYPSISASPAHATECRACVGWLADFLNSLGLDASVRETGGAPAVVARSPRTPDRPTLLLYGHADVQPVEPLGLWTTPPFEPTVRDGLVFARGATDNKGQTFSHLIGLKRALTAGDLPVNLVVLIEGEEEIGSPHLGAFLHAHRDELACDVALISDTSMIEPGWPALTLGLRGVACFEIVATGPKADLHSGMFGGVTPNPALALSRALARLHDDRGLITIPGFYENVQPIPEIESEAWKRLPWNAAWFEHTTGIAPLFGDHTRSVLERVWAFPTAEINGLTSGHQGSGSKTIVPARASAKLSFRLVPDQDPDQLAPVVTEWFEHELAREGVTGTALYDHGGLPFHTPPDNPYLAATRTVLTRIFGREPALTREGLSIPVATLIQRELGVPVILAGLGLPDCAAHSPDESYPLAHLDLGARTFIELMTAFADASR